MTSPTSPVQREAKHEVNEAAPSESETGFLRKQILAYDLLTGEFDRPRSSAITPQPRHINVFLRMHRRLIGTVVVATDKHVDSSNDADKMLVSKIVHAAWQDHQSEIIAHLTSDGIAAPREENDLLTLPERANACKNALDALPGEEPFVTVAIATKSNADSCIETVRHIRENNFSNYEIVIVDNSVDDPEESAKLAAGLGSIEALRLIVEPRRGLSFARNTAYENARGKYVLFTDDDVKVDKIWIRTIVAIFEKDPSVACVTGSIISSEIETPAQAWLEQYGGYHKGFDTRIYDLDEHRSDYPLYPYDAGRFGSGANMAFRLDALSEIGGFSIDLGAGIPAHAGEDIDVLRRIVSAGHRLVYEPSAVLWHHHRR